MLRKPWNTWHIWDICMSMITSCQQFMVSEVRVLVCYVELIVKKTQFKKQCKGSDL